MSVSVYVKVRQYFGRPEEGVLLLQPKLQALENHLIWVLGTKLKSSARTVHTLKHFAVSPLPPPHLLLSKCLLKPLGKQNTTNKERSKAAEKASGKSCKKTNFSQISNYKVFLVGWCYLISVSLWSNRIMWLITGHHHIQILSVYVNEWLDNTFETLE